MSHKFIPNPNLSVCSCCRLERLEACIFFRLPISQKRYSEAVEECKVSEDQLECLPFGEPLNKEMKESFGGC